MMKVSFGSWAFTFGPYARRPLPLTEVSRMIAAAGFDGIEIGGFPPHLSFDSTPTQRREVREMLADLHLGVSAYAPDFTMVNPLVYGKAQRYLDAFSRALALCVELDCPALRVDTIAAPGSLVESEYRDTADYLAGLWRDAAERAETASVKLLWEFEPGFVFNKPSEVVDIYEQVGHQNFNILFDTAHAYLCGVVGARQQGETETLQGGVAEFIDMLSGRIGHVHIVDTDGTLYGEETSTHCALGEGVIDFKALAPKLKAIPGIDWWCVDLSFNPNSERLLASSLQYVRRLLA
jgi:sugar phosphate isomerase/epimerase